MTGPNFDRQEQFDIRTVEAVTRTKHATIRQWETRGVYVSELRRRAEFERNLIVSGKPNICGEAEETLLRIARGWRRYVLSDLVRIAFINALIQVGVEAFEAGQAAMVLSLPEGEANSVPSGREWLRQQNGLHVPDEYVVFVPGRELFPLRMRNYNGNPAQFRLDPKRASDVLSELGDAVGITLNLSRLRLAVLARLEEFEGKERA